MNATDLFIMGRTVWGEARGESQQGKLAVAWVIRNRHDSGRWLGRGSIADVCQLKYQFSCWNDTDINREKLLNVQLTDPVFLDCLWAALGAITGRDASPVGGSCHFLVHGTSATWAAGRIPEYAIGDHDFYEGVP